MCPCRRPSEAAFPANKDGHAPGRRVLQARATGRIGQWKPVPKIYLCFLWHMHQPFYKDLVSGEYRLPWTRLHALKDYYGMVRILEDFPQIRQTFNLVPSMIVQVEEYARGEARDPFLECALKPAETLTPAEQTFILRNFFMANVARMINRYPRYAELWTAHNAQSAAHDTKG